MKNPRQGEGNQTQRILLVGFGLKFQNSYAALSLMTSEHRILPNPVIGTRLQSIGDDNYVLGTTNAVEHHIRE